MVVLLLFFLVLKPVIEVSHMLHTELVMNWGQHNVDFNGKGGGGGGGGGFSNLCINDGIFHNNFLKMSTVILSWMVIGRDEVLLCIITKLNQPMDSAPSFDSSFKKMQNYILCGFGVVAFQIALVTILS